MNLFASVVGSLKDRRAYYMMRDAIWRGVVVVFYSILLRLFGHPFSSGLAALIPVEAFLVCSSALAKKVLVGSKWGNDHSTSFWSWRHFTYFFAQDCFFAWCGRPLRILAGTVLANVILRRMGCRIGKRTLLTEPLQASDWNAVSIGDDCVVAGLLQLHSFENMTLKVKRTEIQNGTSGPRTFRAVSRDD